MGMHKLRIEDLSVESFHLSDDAPQSGTVHGHVDAEGTILSICHSCGGTCDEFTCKRTDQSCVGQFTCDYDRTCAPQYTCIADICLPADAA